MDIAKLPPSQLAEIAEGMRSLRAIAEEQWPGFDDWANNEKGFLLGNNKIVEIGRTLNRIGGLELMQTICYATFPPGEAQSQMERSALSELNWAWHGIGDWLA